MSILLDLLFPPMCLRCRARVGRHGTFCAECWQQLAFISEPLCGRCGVPFDFAPAHLSHCPECMREPPPFSQSRAVLRYDEASRLLALRLKYHDDTALASVYGPWLARAGAELLSGCDAIVPVPLHYWRFVKRRYNQAALLAGAVAKQSGLPVSHALKRIKPTPPQTGLRKKERAANMAGAFALRKGANLRGKTLLLVDDVYTTGATLSACAEVLLDNGARDVRALTLARRC